LHRPKRHMYTKEYLNHFQLEKLSTVVDSTKYISYLIELAFEHKCGKSAL